MKPIGTFLQSISAWTVGRHEQASLLGLYKSWRSILSFILWGMFQHVSIHCYMEENFLNQIIYQSISTLSTKYLIKVTCPGSEIVTIMKISSSKCIKFYIWMSIVTISNSKFWWCNDIWVSEGNVARQSEMDDGSRGVVNLI